MVEKLEEYALVKEADEVSKLVITNDNMAEAARIYTKPSRDSQNLRISWLRIGSTLVMFVMTSRSRSSH
ncbi:hypothetical protein [Vulcanisaeta distributa]|uniref:hypothetical protein n=1 Tax=Vulcanisaeta distributa TaxID=164451 RepID=UPI000AF29550|nr:hypothetical protein [Vulcanisaeta distributa]